MAPDPIPFHSTEAPDRDGGSRVLLISYHFPPSTAAGALRWQKLASYLAERGWILDVITLDPRYLTEPEWSRLADLPPGTRVYGVPKVELRREKVLSAMAAAVRRVRRRGERQAAVPPGSPNAPSAPRAAPGQLIRIHTTFIDYAAQRRWSAWAERLARRIADRASHRAVITCGPPHMMHEAGRRIGQALGLPFVMDLRDPWRLVERLADVVDTPVWRWLAAWHEGRTLPRAALVIANTEAARDAMRLKYPRAASRIIAVMNGFDDEPPPPERTTHRFIVAYSGSIYLDRDPRPLFRAAARLVERRRLTPSQFGIVLIGHVTEFAGVSTNELAREAGVEAFVETMAHRPRRETMQLLAQATVLVSLPQDSHMAIPSKVFEYMQFDAWLLAFNEPWSATARLLEATSASVIPPGDVDRTTAVLEDYFDRYRRGERPRRLAVVERFGRRHQANILLDALEAVCQGSDPRSH